MTTSAWPSSSDITAVISAIRAFCSGVAKSWPMPSPDEITSGRFLVSCSKRLERSSGVGARSTARLWVRLTMWSRSHGTAVNCTRWVSSCIATQRRKSVGSTSRRRSVATMLGATRSSRGVPPGARSYCPRTLLEKKASRPPISAPVTLLPMAAAVALLGWPFLRVLSLSTTGSSIALNESTLASIQPARSTTSDAGASSGAVSRLVSATGPTAAVAAARRSATISAASSLDTCGPGLTMVRPVRLAKS